MKEKRVQVAFRVPASLAKELDIVAKTSDLSKQEIGSMALEKFLKKDITEVKEAREMKERMKDIIGG